MKITLLNNQNVAKLQLCICFILIAFNGFSNRERQRKDVLYYNNDTLQVRKIYVNTILRKIKHQKKFEYKKSGIKGNQYTAHWKIENGKLFLLRIQSANSLYDTLDLKQAFQNKYKNGRVDLTKGNKLLSASDRKLLRNNNFFGSSFLTDYIFQIKKGNIIKVDSVFHYIDNPKRLNRKTDIDMSIYLYKAIVSNTIPKKNDSLISKIRLNLTIEYNIKGEFEKCDVSALRFVETDKDSVYAVNLSSSISDYFDISKLNRELRSLVWDEMPGMYNDVISLNFWYSEELKRLTGSLEGADRAAYRYF